MLDLDRELTSHADIVDIQATIPLRMAQLKVGRSRSISKSLNRKFIAEKEGLQFCNPYVKTKIFKELYKSRTAGM